mmetsp:Transcript_18983/g.43251  ORF Transcript_18983/g.43251 Transcript_18983/m.43251 type:complete len:194 (-) Transcript_18983:102-683(-)|eukprot:CAMPEP_0113297514 /NCGR_PEP_ID=MMETSP0010_2-20120614/342_1 /TAXON_ID=216773 ORGANISM="Corethron hystrix, Strain 308" /NCGR_SAMPLE_ID=MMETSP0010_2 /ASSEMBLY_ACC=CAM_ASM_000155 /LENGTH=193 /DNA_ID=CAMNT_0000150411 /DNA_START=119 /DNA_END=700 /DNA_ORIENTATION=- /assembly_acc=CAM_ASM_000155
MKSATSKTAVKYVLAITLTILCSTGTSLSFLNANRRSASSFYRSIHPASSHPVRNKLGPIFSSSDQTSVVEETFDELDDVVIRIRPSAMERLQELRSKSPDPSKSLVLRMGVRSGGCSGMSYAMDFAEESSITEDDMIDEYITEGIKCIVDPKSMLYLYGMELDYSTELVGGGFKFFNPNAESTCGCGSSFGV